MEISLTAADGRRGHVDRRRPDAHGELTGDFLALDADTGAVKYRFNTGGPIGAGIVTYKVAGRQYIAVASGRPSRFWIEQNSGNPLVMVFALP